MNSGWFRLFIVITMLLLGSVRSWRVIGANQASAIGGLAMRIAQRTNPMASSMTPLSSSLFPASASMTVRFQGTHRASRRRSGSSGSGTAMRDFRRGGGGGYGSNGGGAQNPFAKLSFKHTVKIDPDHTTAVTEMPFSDVTKTVLQQKGFSKMTPVQSQSYEHVFSGADVVARSRTGTGKTFAFGVPLIEKIITNGYHRRRTEGSGLPVILILEPTRELAIQVSQELSILCKPHRLRVSAVYGGSSFSLQEKLFREGVHIVVSTPGRLLDHIRSNSIDLSHVEHVVLDEGDTMLEMGFQKDVESILMNVKVPGETSREIAARTLDNHNLNKYDTQRQATFIDMIDGDLTDSTKKVQLLLFSATMPGWICSLTDKLMQNPIFLDAVQEGETRLAATITHYALQIQPSAGHRLIDTVSGLIEDIILTKGEGGQTIVFTNTKEDADILVNSDCFGRLKSQVLHGDISQSTRQTTLRQFKDGSIDVLVATDVAARGLDISGVELVIHTAPPNDGDSYVHRSGRTGRAGRSGTSVLLYTNSDASKLRQFERELKFKFTSMSAPSVNELALASSSYAVKQMSLVEDEVIAHFRPYARSLLQKAMAGELFDVIDPSESTVDTTVDATVADANNNTDIVAAAGNTTVAGNTTSTVAIEIANKTESLDNQQIENLIARCIATISNRMSIPARSILTGEEGMMTLQFHALGEYAPKSFAIPIWQRFALNLLAKKLGMDNVRFGKLQLGYDEKRNLLLLADVEKAVATEILEKIQTVKLPREVRVVETLTLPQMHEDSESSRDGDRRRGGNYGRGGQGGGYGDRGGNRSYGDRGGDRGHGDRGGDRGYGDRGGDRGGRGGSDGKSYGRRY